MIHAAIFKTTNPAERATLLVAGSPAHIALNVPPGGCWRELPAGCTSAADAPALGALDAQRGSAAVSAASAPHKVA